MKKINFLYSIYGIIFVSFIVRLIVAYYFGDKQLENEWIILIHNLSTSGILGFNVVVDNYLAIPKLADPKDIVLPSVFMPPLYAYFIYFVKILSLDLFDFVKIVIFLQIIFSLVAIYLFFKIMRNFENFNFSFLLTLVFSFIPISLYSSSQISSISIQVLLITYFLYFIIKLLRKKSFKNFFLFSIISGLLILVRGEFILFYFLTMVYFFFYYSKDTKSFIIILTLTSLIISPYLLRNYNHFNSFVLTKSFGYNLLKGNNPEFKAEGNANFIYYNYDKKNLQLKTNKNYEIKLDNFYKKEALQFIKEDPSKFVNSYFLKVFSFLFLDMNSTYPNYYNFLHIIPKMIISITSLVGALLAIRKKGFYQFISLYYFSNIFFFSIFFILPRYSLMLLPVQLLLSIEPIRLLFRFFIDSSKKIY